jgi:Uma2 family endonuclease
MENFERSGLMSVEEYLEFERDSEVRHEYVGGVTYAMTGASRRHNRIAGRIYRRLSDIAEGGTCRTFISDMKVLTPDGLGYYPDVMVACADEPEDEYTETEPCLIVEVVSPNTESKDRREKLVAYRKIPTLEAYLVVDQKRRHVERYFRDENGEWNRAELTGEGRFPVPCPPGAELSLAEIYKGL